jgi:hypothetical protein
VGICSFWYDALRFFSIDVLGGVGNGKLTQCLEQCRT